MPRQRSFRGLVAVAVVVVGVIASATPAAAHAELVSTDPVGGAVLEDPPRRIALRFSDAVEVNAGSVRLYDDTGERLRTGPPQHAGGVSSEVEVSVPELDDGAYVVTWRVVSADSHPVHGAFTIRVGSAATTDTRPLTERLLASEGGNTAVGAVYGVVRFLSFASIALLIGGTFFAIVLWPAGMRQRRSRRMLAAAWAGSVLTTAAAIPLQGVYAAGLDIVDTVDWAVTSDVIGTRFGDSWLVRLVLLAVGGPLLVLVARGERPTRSWVFPLLVVVAIGVLVTPAVAGHPGSDEVASVSVLADAVHLGAVCVWLGGLAMLLVTALRHDVDEPGEVASRFSAIATGAIAVILVTGIYQGWRQSRSIDAVTDTTYGQLLLTKIVFFVALIGVATISRSWVRRSQPERPSLARIRRTVGAEVGIAGAVLVATALLVNTVPAKTAVARPQYVELRTDRVLIDVTVDPAKAGLVDLHVYTVTLEGAITDVPEIAAELALPGREIGPLRVPLQQVGPGHLAAYGFDIPIPGDWQVSVTVRTTEVGRQSATALVRIR